MRVLAVVLGSTGDVIPFVALGHRLARDGHDLAIACFPEFGETVLSAGLGFVEVPGDSKAWMKRLLGDASGVADAVKGMRELLGDPAIFDALEGAVRRADIVLYTQFGIAARHLAEAAGLPCVRVQVYPTDPSRSYSMMDPRRNDETWRAPVLHRMADLMMNWALLPSVRTWRSRLGLSRWGLFSDARAMGGEPIPTLYQFSPTLVPPDPAWGDHIHVTGEWLEEPPSSEELPQQVEDFLASGPAPVLVGFGSVVSSAMREVHEVVQRCLLAQGQRIIVIGPEASGSHPHQVLTLPWVPFRPLLPRCQAVVCHGSLGTTGAALRAGRPCLVFAFGGDQQFHGQSVVRSGAGPAYVDVPRDGLGDDLVAGRIADLISGRYDIRASELSARLLPENGVELAAEVVTALAASSQWVGRKPRNTKESCL